MLGSESCEEYTRTTAPPPTPHLFRSHQAADEKNCSIARIANQKHKGVVRAKHNGRLGHEHCRHPNGDPSSGRSLSSLLRNIHEGLVDHLSNLQASFRTD